MAAHKALNTAEVLEMIFFQLPTHDLLLSQRVCKTWHDNIAASKRLQRALFSLPANGEPPEYDVRRQVVFVRPGSDRKATVYGNSLLSSLCQGEDIAPSSQEPFAAAWLAPTASWRRMLLCQPSAGNINMRIERSADGFIHLPLISNDCRAADFEEVITEAWEENEEMEGEVCGYSYYIEGFEPWKMLASNEQIEELSQCNDNSLNSVNEA